MINHINILILTPLCSNKNGFIFSLGLGKLGPLLLIHIKDKQRLAYKIIYDGKVILIDEVLEVNGKLARLLIGTELVGSPIKEASIEKVVIRVYGKAFPRCDSVDPVRKDKQIVFIQEHALSIGAT
jgi:hypothetical protein